MTELINENPFYFGTIQKITGAVGTIFNNISIQRKNDDGTINKSFKVPLTYGSKQHWFYRKTQSLPYTEEAMQTVGHPIQLSRISIPRMCYLLDGFAYDSSRKINSLNKIKLDAMVGPNQEKIRTYQYAPVPFLFNYTLSVVTRNMTDGLQIVEQFVPYFNPVVNLKILEIKETDTWNDVSVTIAGQNFTDNYESGFEDKNIKIWDFNLVVKANLYPPVRNQKVILTSIVGIENLDPLHDLEVVTVAANPGELRDKDNSTITVQITEPGS